MDAIVYYAKLLIFLSYITWAPQDNDTVMDFIFKWKKVFG